MRRLLFLALGLIVAAGMASAPASAADTAEPTLQQFLKVRVPSSPYVLPDQSLLYRDWPDGIWQLYHVTPKKKGKDLSYLPADVTKVVLTDYPDGLSGFTVSPDGRWVLLLHARGGNENTQITLMDFQDRSGATRVPVVDNPDVQASVNAWLRDGSGFFYSANDESPTDFYLYRYDIASGARTKILGNTGYWFVADVTADASRAIVGEYLSASNSRLYELNLASGELTEITIKPENGTASCEPVGYMPGDAAVLMTSDIEDGMGRLFLKDLATGTVTKPIPALDRFELDGASPNETRQFLVAVTNEDGFGVINLFTLPDFQPVPSPETDKGIQFPASFRGTSLVWSMNNARTPGGAYLSTYSAENPTAKPTTRQLTWPEDQGLDLAGFALPELVRYPTFDGREIPAFLFLPNGYKKGTAIPFIVNYHGGPEAQHRPYFSAQNQYMLTQGFGILMPNVRGSTGYGREFHMLDDYKNRWDSVKDGVAAAEWLVAQGYAEPGRIATYGGSYGGFMSVACIVEDQERVDRGERAERMFGASVNVVGITNLKTFLERTSGYRQKLREVEYGPLSDPEFLESVSAMNRIDKIQVPMFIAHGFNDPRVPVEEAMQIAAALRERKQNPQLFVAPDEGHGFAKLDNRIYYGERVVAFLKETIGEAPVPTP